MFLHLCVNLFTWGGGSLSREEGLCPGGVLCPEGCLCQGDPPYGNVWAILECFLFDSFSLKIYENVIWYVGSSQATVNCTVSANMQPWAKIVQF